MSRRNDRSRKQARSARSSCKPGRWTTKKLADAFLLKKARWDPYNALGMQSYLCQCGFWHIGRAPSR